MKNFINMWRVFGLRTAISDLKLRTKNRITRMGLGWRDCQKRDWDEIKVNCAIVTFFILVAMVWVGIIISANQESKKGNIQKIETITKIEKVVAVKIISGATITAYNSEIGQTDSTPDITANGSRTRVGVIACPRRFSFGTKVEYTGQYYICEDRMNERYDCSDGECVEERWDIWMESKETAKNFGIKHNQTLKIIL